MTTAEITAESTMTEVLTAYPGAQRALMRRYHIGGCSSCGFEPHELLVDVLRRKNVLDVAEVIDHIKDAHEQESKLQITAASVAEKLKGENPPKLIDVRMPQEQEICMIDGAMPASQQLVQEMMESWSKDTPIVTYCHQGMRSLDAASFLIGHGFTNVLSMTGGIHAWAAEVDPEMATY
ncbi:MAG: rhodanese-like domain-containing protein [Planctomycetota bacterium]|jgi:rhodanese-related sulfurtransferase